MKYQKLLQQLNDLYRCPLCNLYLDNSGGRKFCLQNGIEADIGLNYSAIAYRDFTLGIFNDRINIYQLPNYHYILTISEIEIDNAQQLFQQVETIINFS